MVVSLPFKHVRFRFEQQVPRIACQPDVARTLDVCIYEKEAGSAFVRTISKSLSQMGPVHAPSVTTTSITFPP